MEYWVAVEIALENKQYASYMTTNSLHTRLSRAVRVLLWNIHDQGKTLSPTISIFISRSKLQTGLVQIKNYSLPQEWQAPFDAWSQTALWPHRLPGLDTYDLHELIRMVPRDKQVIELNFQDSFMPII